MDSFLNKKQNCELDVVTVLSNYDSIFNEPLNIENDTMNVGDDGLSSYMLLNINKEFFESVVLSFFQFIITYGVIPANLNNTHIIPIIKDKTQYHKMSLLIYVQF